MGISKSDYMEHMEQSKETLYRIAYSYMKDPTLALDALDEAFYKGYINRKKIKNPEFLGTWLTRILINECLQILRKNKHELLIDQLPEESSEVYDRLPLKEALSKIPENLSNVIYLRYYGGYTLAETAVILEIPQGTVATRERRALALLRLELED
ncbi:sigma-70 family RNA polymerase sigma factor [Anaeromicropila herbilytica]|uniref:DNA-directed RNA polymerase sigma-70 factor n=1 Tax=Anaeromicropila herbilytica TaxID=2785025 RepID=A0A7R7EHQ8_9FIRM|nr:sigma-70 family RNA polymerase sigma factor [Anaeromicropila herbilytica]BCN28919.1 DNA-directed RNA polymerase sigma-70 factor [Anaeromicropila herbilytica]